VLLVKGLNGPAITHAITPLAPTLQKSDFQPIAEAYPRKLTSWRTQLAKALTDATRRERDARR
jgi:hypothetical protein